MSSQVHKSKPQAKVETSEEDPPKVKSADELKAELDSVLDDIEEALEENAEEFVRNYVQKGGE